MGRHFCDRDCPDDCIGTETGLQWSHYPHGRYPDPGGKWRLERVFTAERNVKGNREIHRMFFPVLVVNDGK